MDKYIPERIFLWKSEMNEFLNGERKQVQIGINQDNLPGLLTYVLWKDVSQKVEQPDVDLEKELAQWTHKHFRGKRDGDYNGEYLERESQLGIARHFYELGLNARKEK